MQCFIAGHYLDKSVDVYCGGPDIFKGTVESCAENVLTLNYEGKYTHIAIDKIIALWPTGETAVGWGPGASGHHVRRK